MSCLHVRNLSVGYASPQGVVRAVDGVSFDHVERETLALVGETGCGKTTVANAIMRLLPENATVRGQVSFLGRDMLSLNEREMAKIRGKEIGIVFQNPEGALNPSKRVKTLLYEVCNLVGMDEATRRERVREIVETVGLPTDVLHRYPSQLSGGQNQRVALGRILLLGPDLIVLDEPTSALDVSVQAQILHLLKKLQKTKNLTYLFISHNRDVIRFMCDRVGLLEEGELSFFDIASKAQSENRLLFQDPDNQ